MRFDLNRHSARMELRVLELEDSVAAISRILATMTGMLGDLNRIATHYADTVSSLMPALPARSALPPPYRVGGEPGAGRCPGGGCACGAAPDD